MHIRRTLKVLKVGDSWIQIYSIPFISIISHQLKLILIVKRGLGFFIYKF